MTVSGLKYKNNSEIVIFYIEMTSRKIINQKWLRLKEVNMRILRIAKMS